MACLTAHCSFPVRNLWLRRAMKLSVVLVVLASRLYLVDSLCSGCTRTEAYDVAWESYKTEYNKVYSSCFDECKRRTSWERTCKKIEDIKSGSKYGFSSRESSFTMKVNNFGDWTDEERATRLNGLSVPTVVASNEPELTEPPILASTLPTYLNYTELGYVTPVKDQGSCGNCWAYSATGAIEGQLRKKYGKLIDLSVQQMNDCCNNMAKYNCGGCAGGWMNGAFTCTNDIRGMVTSDVCPLQRKNMNCSISPVSNYTRYSCNGYTTTVPYDESSMMEHLVSKGPLACAFDASATTFQYYRSGIYNDPTCSRKVNHAVLVTGYGTTNTSDKTDYWIVKNSWGTGWGENGYFRVIRNLNLCDINHYCSSPNNCTKVN